MLHFLINTPTSQIFTVNRRLLSTASRKLLIVRHANYDRAVLGETLAIEVAQFSIKVLIVLPGAFRTEGRVGQDIFQGNKIADYNELRELVGEKIRNPPDTGGDPKKAMEILVDVVRGEGVAEGKAWPLYLPLGRDAEQAILDKTETVGEVLKEWKDVICSTDFEKEE